ncbi:MAG TPA: ribosome small subunit-dependent GTPase A [Tepidisphaeraceae bacterium]|nr:ribosome small subunit-dependent GTPase A [Tepidisphaeraceae bacterium]
MIQATILQAMSRKPKKSPREKDVTSRFNAGDLDDDRLDNTQRFSSKSKHYQADKTAKTSLMRAEEQAELPDIEQLPIGEVVQVYSMYCDVEHAGRKLLCVVRKTLTKVSGADIVVGDFVRFRDLGVKVESGQPEAIIEQMLPRKTVLTRADSFKAIVAQPIVANAEQMLIVASFVEPKVKWSLVDRMLVAARSGGLEPIICLNKVDLPRDDDEDWQLAQQAMQHYRSLGIKTLQTSVIDKKGIEALRELLRDRTTVLAGHSGVGKSSLIRALQPSLDLRIAAISGYTGKGRHTTTSARRYPLEFGGWVIDTPGVKMFGLWNVTRETLPQFFPDIVAGNAPPWRRESFERIEASLIS